MSEVEIPCLNSHEADACEGLVTMKEITEAITSMKPNKAPGFDGLSVELYKEFWSEVNDLVLQSLNEAFEGGHLSYSQRKGVITLLFKGGDKQELEHWRPITL